MKKIISILLLILIFIACCKSKITIVSYNVQNLFDDVDDGTEYSEYKSKYNIWSRELFIKKLKNISRVIKDSFTGGPDIVALQEIENTNTLEVLNNLFLGDMGYIYRVLVPAPESATNTAILSRFLIKRVGALYSQPGQNMGLRNILEAEIEYKKNILYIFNNHWKSHIDNSFETEKLRIESARTIRKRIMEILKQDSEADIIVLGDFNENVEEYIERNKMYQTALLPNEFRLKDYKNNKKTDSIFLAKYPGKAGVIDEACVLYCPWYEIPKDDWGSYEYRKKWYTFDQILLSSGLFNKSGYFYDRGNFKIMRFSYMLDEYTGFPKEWNTSKKDGYSDHLPLLIKLSITKVK